ncbi:uncharacterized protein LOC100897502 [Galendromus occidentalis]|uniref:Uncharacterized protein LOC100897502 n=1 Tax=Galendromus occidentalis TaxID=34638 RepID=A0AAJ6W0I7_9ACAR|nr:uncharacterized protein LOC100897502 [Galendromus occidentalis]
MALQVPREMSGHDSASPAGRSSRRRSFSRRPSTNADRSSNSIEHGDDPCSAMVGAIFKAAEEAICLVSKELKLSHEEESAVKTKFHSIIEELGARGGPIEGVCRSLIEKGLCPPKRLKTESVEDFYIRTLQQTVNDWDVDSVQNLLAEKTQFEPLPAMDESLDTTSPSREEDRLEKQFRKTQDLSAAETSYEEENLKSWLSLTRSRVDNPPARGVTARALMSHFNLCGAPLNKAAC